MKVPAGFTIISIDCEINGWREYLLSELTGKKFRIDNNNISWALECHQRDNYMKTLPTNGKYFTHEENFQFFFYGKKFPAFKVVSISSCELKKDFLPEGNSDELSAFCGF